MTLPAPRDGGILNGLATEQRGNGGAIMPRRVNRALACGLAMAGALGANLPAWGQGATERVSLGPNGVQGNGSSGNISNPVLSADGRFVAFDSAASNLVPGDTNGVLDVFVHDRRLGTTRRVSVGPNGRQGNAGSYAPVLSANGRFVAFYSAADNLVRGDTNRSLDVFVHDRRLGTTRRVSVGPNGRQGNAGSYVPVLSANGRFVAFDSAASNLVPGDTNDSTDVFVHDRRLGATRRVSVGPNGRQGNDGSTYAALPADGRFVAFTSFASNLVPGDTNGALDVFVHTLAGAR
jgi:Tol biopolymer transport system component